MPEIKAVELHAQNVCFQWTHDVYTTSPERRYNVMTLHRRSYYVVKTSCARLVGAASYPLGAYNRETQTDMLL